jgi:hypothetical protein
VGPSCRHEREKYFKEKKIVEWIDPSIKKLNDCTEKKDKIVVRK